MAAEEEAPRCAEAGSSGRIGVVRDAFTPFNAREYPLHTTVASLAEGQVAVHSAAAFEPQGIVVDEYVKDSARGVYRLTNIATDLLRCDFGHCGSAQTMYTNSCCCTIACKIQMADITSSVLQAAAARRHQSVRSPRCYRSSQAKQRQGHAARIETVHQ